MENGWLDMRKSIEAVAVFALAGTGLTGCMMMGMCGGMMGGGGQQQSQAAREGEPIVKETTYDNYRIVAEFLPLKQLQESDMSLRIRSSSDSRSVAATVTIIITVAKREGGAENVILEERLSPTKNGEYNYSFTPHDSGVYHITFLIEQLGNTVLEKPVILSGAHRVE